MLWPVTPTVGEYEAVLSLAAQEAIKPYKPKDYSAGSVDEREALLAVALQEMGWEVIPINQLGELLGVKAFNYSQFRDWYAYRQQSRILNFPPRFIAWKKSGPAPRIKRVGAWQKWQQETLLSYDYDLVLPEECELFDVPWTNWMWALKEISPGEQTSLVFSQVVDPDSALNKEHDRPWINQALTRAYEERAEPDRTVVAEVATTTLPAKIVWEGMYRGRQPIMARHDCRESQRIVVLTSEVYREIEGGLLLSESAWFSEWHLPV